MIEMMFAGDMFRMDDGEMKAFADLTLEELRSVYAKSRRGIDDLRDERNYLRQLLMAQAGQTDWRP